MFSIQNLSRKIGCLCHKRAYYPFPTAIRFGFDMLSIKVSLRENCHLTITQSLHQLGPDFIVSKYDWIYQFEVHNNGILICSGPNPIRPNRFPALVHREQGNTKDIIINIQANILKRSTIRIFSVKQTAIKPHQRSIVTISTKRQTSSEMDSI